MRNFAVVIPALAPGQDLVTYVEGLIRSEVRLVLVVNDGSPRAYDSVFQKLTQLNRVHVLNHETNQGKGASLKTAFSYLLGAGLHMDAVVTADADGQHLLKDVLAIGDFFTLRGEDYVLGTRNFKKSTVPGRSRLGNVVTSHIFFALYGKFYSDTQTGLRGIAYHELEDIVQLAGTRFDYETNLLVYMAQHDKKVARYDIQTVYEKNHQSHYRTVMDSARILSSLLKPWLGWNQTEEVAYDKD